MQQNEIDKFKEDVILYSIHDLSKNYGLTHQQLYKKMYEYGIRKSKQTVYDYVMNKLLIEKVSIDNIKIDKLVIARLLVGANAKIDDLNYLELVKFLHDSNYSEKEINNKTNRKLGIKKINHIIKKYVLWQK
jgi:hypothetical protein